MLRLSSNSAGTRVLISPLSAVSPDYFKMAATKVFFTQFEKELVLALVKPNLDIVDNKETNGVIFLKKKKVFDEITRQFNTTDGVSHPRTSQQIRQCYLNLKKKLSKKNSVLCQERRKTGGGEEPNEELTDDDVEMRLLVDPIPMMPVSTLFDGADTKPDISISQDDISTTSASDPLINPIIPSQQSTSTKTSDMDASLDPSRMTCSNSEEIVKAKPSHQVSGLTTKPFSKLRENLTMFRKNSREPTASSTAARAAACIETEHRTTMRHMLNEERRKEKQSEAEYAEHELRMELLREQIKQTKTKTKLYEELLASLGNKSDNASFKIHDFE